MSTTPPRRHWVLMAIVAVLAFGAVMFFAGRATAPTESTESTNQVAASDAGASTGNDGTTDDAAADEATTDESTTGGRATKDTATKDTATKDTATGDDSLGSDEGDALPPGCELPDDFPMVALSDLPSEAYDTISVIADGPPYPYRADGGVFQNREGILPDRERGYYHEFTVETPGSSDRGARRIVIGDCGEFFYTADHYDSFELIDLER